jgi:hypothetical protein
MKMHKVLVVSALLAVSGTALAGKQGTAGGAGSGTGGVINSGGALNASFGGGLLNAPPNPSLFSRISGLPGAVQNDDGTVTSPPIRMPDGSVVRVTCDSFGKILSVDKV